MDMGLVMCVCVWRCHLMCVRRASRREATPGRVWLGDTWRASLRGDTCVDERAKMRERFGGGGERLFGAGVVCGEGSVYARARSLAQGKAGARDL